MDDLTERPKILSLLPLEVVKGMNFLGEKRVIADDSGIFCNVSINETIIGDRCRFFSRLFA